MKKWNFGVMAAAFFGCWLIIAGVRWYIHADAECSRRGGFLVRGVGWGFVCVKELNDEDQP